MPLCAKAISALCPLRRTGEPDGSILANTGDEFAFEYVLGTRGRSTEQWMIWQAVLLPRGCRWLPCAGNRSADGRDRQAGGAVLARSLRPGTAILKREWPTLGPKLEGKLHIAVGDGDTYFLNNAVHLLQKQLDATKSPHSDATFQYGPGMPHCYTGGPAEYTMQQNNANWAQRLLPQMTDHMIKTAPVGADTKSWVY